MPDGKVLSVQSCALRLSPASLAAAIAQRLYASSSAAILVEALFGTPDLGKIVCRHRKSCDIITLALHHHTNHEVVSL